MNKLYILDVSGYIFRAYYALPPMTNAQGEATHALYGFVRSILKLLKTETPEHIVAVFDAPDNKKQRKGLYGKYKANRTTILDDLPEQMEKAKQFCDLIGIPHIEIPGVEADDTMGSIAVWAAKLNTEVYLCTSDKDLCQLVGEKTFVLNPWKDNLILDKHKVEELYGVPPEKMIDYLAMVGDASDNIPGIKGFGPKTTVSLLKKFGTLENLLDHPEQVQGEKKQEIVREQASSARLSKQLATIHTNIAFPKEQTFFAKNSPQLDQLKSFYLRCGFNTLLKELAPIPKTESLNYQLVDDENCLDNLLKYLNKHKEICFDLETTHLRPLLAHPVGIGFSVQEQEAFYVPFNGKLGQKLVQKKLKPLFENPELGFFGHNAKYDVHVLANCGISVANLCFDTILASYLLNSASRKHSLDTLTLQYFDKVKIPIKDLIGSGKKQVTMDLVPIEKVCNYCCEDVDYTLRIKKLLEKELVERKLDSILFNLELPLSSILTKMERAGVYLNQEELILFSKELVEHISCVEKEIYGLAEETFNVSSPKQLAHILFEKLAIKPIKKTATGFSTNADVLAKLAKTHPIAQKVLAYRSLEKLRSTYVETLPQEIHPKTGRIHPTFNQFVTATGRLACQDPNLQNIPVRTEQGRRIRAAFKPQKPGWSYLSADYSQVELRLLAHLSEDPSLIKAFKKGEDIHRYTAALMWNVPVEEISNTQRQQAKAINFGIIYGQQAYGLSQELGIEVKEAAAFIQAYFERYPYVRHYIEACVDRVKKTGKTQTITKRERDIPDIHSQNAIMRSSAERLAINTPLQGSAADMIKIAMLEVDKQLTKHKMESFLILQVHDELIFESPNHEIEKLAPLVKKAMEEALCLKVPLTVDLSVGKNWAEC